MKIKTADLLASVEQAIAECTARRDSAHAEAMAQYDKAIAEWNEKHAPEAAALLKGLAAKLRKGQPISSADVRPLVGKWGDGGIVLKSEGPPKPRPVQVPADLLALRTFLGTVDDDTVTSSALVTMGFRNLGALLRSAVAR